MGRIVRLKQSERTHQRVGVRGEGAAVGRGRRAQWEEEGRKEGVPRWRTDDGGGDDERQRLSARARVTERESE